MISLKEAIRKHNNLKSYWSDESHLSQKIMISILDELGKISNQNHQIAEDIKRIRIKKKTKQSNPWSEFAGKCMKEGKTIKEAALLWQEKKK